MSSEKISSKNNSIEETYKNDEENNEDNFYDICIQAIESNNEEILNKEECIKGINELKTKTIKRSSSQRQITKKTDKKIISKKKPVTKKCIDEILEESKIKMEKINKKIEKNSNIFKPNIKSNNNTENNNKINQKNMANNYRKNKQLNEFFKGKQRRYTVLKHINEYLESNDVTMNELIENNPFQDKPYKETGSYEFIEAVKFGNYDYVNDALMNDDVYLFVIDYYGQTGYHWAAKLGNIKILDLLIKFGRHHNQKDFKGRTPLYLAAVNNNIEVCKFLLANGANPFLSDKCGKTPADVAGSQKLSDFLKDSMAQPFSNPVYKARMQKILQDRSKHFFKIEQNELKDQKEQKQPKGGRSYSIKKKNRNTNHLIGKENKEKK